MRYLLDTHILLWAAIDRLPKKAIPYFSEENELYFSPASIWEVVIKSALKRDDFRIDVNEFYYALLSAGYKELPVTSKHTLAIASLPDIHKDPFDRLLLSQAITEKMDLITADVKLSKYPKRILLL